MSEISQGRSEFAPVWKALFEAEDRAKRGSTADATLARLLHVSLELACEEDIPIADALRRKGIDPETLARLA